MQSAFPDAAQDTVMSSDLNLSFAKDEATAITTRWLNEARIARDRVKFSLPLSQAQVDLGDIVALEEAGGQALFRVDQVETGLSRSYDAIRIEQSPYQPAPLIDMPQSSLRSSTIAPVFSLMLDLPIAGKNSNIAPRIAATSAPWGRERRFIMRAMMGIISI